MMKISKILVLIVTISSVVEVNAQTFSWKQKATLPGLSRWGAYKFVIGNLGFVGGGYHNSSLTDFWQYNPINNVWTQMSNWPIATRTAGSFSIAGYGYVVGGIVSPGSNITNSMYQYNPSNNTWLQKASYPGIPVYGAASFAIAGKGYYGVGNAGVATGPYYNDFYEYDPVNNSWTQKSSFPGSARFGTHGIASSTFGYVGLGYDAAINLYYQDWYQYDPTIDSWTQKQNYPYALSYTSSFYINNKIYLVTGKDNNNAYSSMYSFDETNNAWNQEPSFIGSDRWCAFGFAINNIGYFGTGTNLASSTLLSDFYEYSPAETQDSIICITLKPNSIDGKDAHVLSGLPNTNVEPHAEFLACAWTCQGNSCNDREFVQFDMSVIPANATLVSATLGLHANPNPVTIPTANYGSNNAFLIQRVTSPWSESTVTWNTQPITTIQNEVLVPQSTSSGQSYLNLDVTALVNDMRNDPQNSFGFMMRLVNEIPYNGRDFASSDHPDSTMWPSITYCYTVLTGVSNYLVSSNSFKVYPTLFTENLRIEFLSLASEIELDIFNVAGKKVLGKMVKCTPRVKQIVQLTENEINSLNTNEVYFIRITGMDFTETQRIIRAKF